MFRLIAGTLNPASRTEIDDIINFLATKVGLSKLANLNKPNFIGCHPFWKLMFCSFGCKL
jgi:hypothetical protein